MKYFNRRRQLDGGYNALDTLAAQKGVPADIIGQRIIQAKRPQIEAYVTHYGAQPAANPAALALQAALIHDSRINDKMTRGGIPDRYAAENEILGEDQQSFDGGDINASNDFAPALIAVVGAVAGKGIQAINAKRVKEGKKPILQWLTKNTENVTLDKDGDRLIIGIDGKMHRAGDSDLLTGLGAARAELERQAQKDYLRRKLPVIIIGAVLVILVVWYFAKRSK